MPSIIVPDGKAHAKKLAKAVKKGELNRIRQGIYTDASPEEIPQLLKNKWDEVVHALYPDAIASHATAALLVPQNKVVHITADLKIRKKVSVGKYLSIDVHPGNVTILTEPFSSTLFRSAPARYLLENLQIAHRDVDSPKALGPDWVENELCKILEQRGEEELNQLRDDARKYSTATRLSREFTLLNQMISAILSTGPVGKLKTATAIAIAKNEPFDQNRISLFEELTEYLNRCEFPNRNYTYSKASWRNLAFYESYFSNYIEGTEFEINEAEQIIFEKREIENRHQDSHDVLSVFDVVNDYTEMATVPDTSTELMQLLKQRHGMIMHARPDKRPGELKTEPNKSGDTLFVSPEYVEGTLIKGFQLYSELPSGIAKAIFIQFIVTECHPFDDGNGRLARIMMNAELVSVEQHKIIVPTVHRDSYLSGLRQATRSKRFRTITKVFADLQAYTSTIPWEEYGETQATLKSHSADKLPDDGVAIFNRQISKFKNVLPAG